MIYNFIKGIGSWSSDTLTAKLALGMSILTIALVVSMQNTPCISASSCVVGDSETFSGTLKINSGNNFGHTLSGTATADRTLTMPDVSGTVALTSDIPSVPSLTASKIMATDGAGVYSTTNIYPLSLTASKSLSTDGSGNVETNDVYPLSLTASKVAKTDSSGNLTTGAIDITTDITVGTSLQEIRVNAGATALEYFTPSSGGAYTLIDSGTVGNWGTETYVCWYGNTLDATKRYKFIFDSGTGMNSGEDYYIPAYVPVEGDCTSSKNEWEGSSIYANAQQNVGQRGNNEYETYGNQCYTLQGNDQNNAYAGGVNTSNLQGNIEFSAIDNGNGYGFWSLWDWSGVSLNSSGNITGVGIQWGTGSCIVWEDSYTNPFADITGFFVNFEGGTTGTTRSWALYEIDY